MQGKILKHIEAILDTGSILAASRKLYVSQPSLSQYVKRVEQDYGITIFDRTATPWKLTHEGERLISTLRKMDALDKECRQYFADLKGLATGELRIGSTAYRTATLLNPVLAQFKKRYPGIVVKIIEGTTQEVADMVESGRADCGFVITSMVPAGLEHAEVFAEEVLLATSRDFAIAPSDPAETIHPMPDMNLLDGTMFITMKRGQKFNDYYEFICSHFGISLPVALETQSILTVPDLVATGIGSALVPSTIARACWDKKLVLFSLEGILPVNRVSVAWSRRHYVSHATRGFIDVCREVLANNGGRQKSIGTL